MMRRREFIAVVGAIAVWPLAGHTQSPERMRRVGVLSGWSEKDPTVQKFVTAFVQALARLGCMARATSNREFPALLESR